MAAAVKHDDAASDEAMHPVWSHSFSPKMRQRLLLEDKTAWRTVVSELLAVVVLGLILMIITVSLLLSWG